MRLLRSFPLMLVASVAFGVAYFFVVFGLIAHFRHGAELAVSFPLKLLLWLAPGVICGVAYGSLSPAPQAVIAWRWLQIAVLCLVVPFISLNLWAFLGTLLLGFTGGAL